MAINYSDWLEPRILDHITGTSALTMPTNLYIKNHIGDPGEAGTANPAAETTRVIMSFAAAVGNLKATNADIDWASPAASETWSWWSVWDHLTAGNFWYSNTYDSPHVVTLGQPVKLPSGLFSLTS